MGGWGGDELELLRYYLNSTFGCDYLNSTFGCALMYNVE